MRTTLTLAAILTVSLSTAWASDAEARHKAKYGRAYPATEKKIEEARRVKKEQQENAKRQEKQQDKNDKQERERSDVEND